MTRQVILALDSSAAACSVAVWKADTLAAHRYLPMVRGHAEALMPLLVETLSAARLGYADLTHIAVTVGPGAFTGIRVGLAVARGLGLAASLPVIGVTSFAAVAEAVPAAERRDRSLLVLIDSKRDDLFMQYFSPDLAPQGDAAAMTPEAILASLPSGPLLLAGD
ncbi:MAG: tRNA (adenosine(37)-N6)-threonylcarbamoyltransferase complex dimerization subunit type 1 TsaB, partial [Dongiaceae bacterium]